MARITRIEGIGITLVAAAAVVGSASTRALSGIQFAGNPWLDGMIAHQIILLIIATGAAIYARIRGGMPIGIALSNEHPASALRLLGISAQRTWSDQSLALAGKVAIPTALFMLAGILTSEQSAWPLWTDLLWVPIIACSNALGEEVVFRLLPCSLLGGSATRRTTALVSAVIFGLAHVRGAPGGPIGMIMSGILGYVFTLISLDTRSIRIPVIIHAVLDVVIITAVLVMRPV